ncbi:MAG: PAS domain S-box protein [Chloroflexi bacterium]|nr:PAS domain S-box protein [Chloroflexota bacterium]MCC6896047.1 PAS domain S-box protein [Anaerolineae bacterium]
MNIVLELTHNVALLFALTYIYGLISPRTNELGTTSSSILKGVAFGVFGILAMLSAVPLGNGFLVDGRSIIIAIASVFAGFVPTLISVLMIIVCRFSLGGDGAIVAIPITITIVVMSFLLFWQRQHFTMRDFLMRLTVLGILSALQQPVWSIVITGRNAFGEATAPLLILTSAGIVLFGAMLYYQRQQMNIDRALQASEERYRAVVTNMIEGIVVRDAKGKVSASNPAASDILGQTVEKIIGEGPLNREWRSIHEDGSPFTLDDNPALKALATGQAQSNVMMGMYKPDHSITWVVMNSQPLQDFKTRQINGVVTTFVDVTEIRSAQAKLRQERDLLRTLIDSTPDYIFLKDADGRFILTNIAHAKAAGIHEPDDLIGKTAFDVFSTELATQFHADDLHIMQSGKPLVNAERETVDAQGQRKMVLTTKIPWVDKDGNVLGLVGISRDVTERKQLENQTLRLLAEQERVEVLQRFLTDMSHDFRTPLSIINSSVYFLRRENISRDLFSEKINNIEVQSDRMLKLLDDLLEMGQLDQKGVTYNFTPENANDIIQKIAEGFQSLATLKHQTLTFKPATGLPKTNIDVVKISRAIINLVQNAINYTPQGGSIQLSTGFSRDYIEVIVSDTGLGISANDLPHIFERFYRADAARSIATGGSGLGLPITKQIVHGHEGTISVHSELDKGTSFTIQLPIIPPVVALP